MLLRSWSMMLLAVLSVSPICAQEWPRFRGPNGSGVSEAKVPTRWIDKDYAWQVKLAGRGHSSPVLWGDRLFTTSASEDALLITCRDAATGRMLWDVSYAAGAPRGHKDNSLASATPAVDAKHIYISWGTPKAVILLALTHDGKEAWRCDLGPYRAGHGFGSSPIVITLPSPLRGRGVGGEGARLVIQPCEDNGKDCLVAVDANTGKERWRAARKSRNNYATPCIHQLPGKNPELIAVSYEDGITSLDPATGKLNWAVDAFDKRHVEASIASPIVHGDLIFGTSGWLAERYETIAVRPGKTKVETLFKLDRDPPLVPTPIAKVDLLFLWNDRGVVTCCNVNTGDKYWSERVEGSFYASPVIAGEYLYCPSREGDMYVLAAGKKFEQVARIALGEGTSATPAIAGGRMFIRTVSRLMCLEAVKKR